MFTILGASGFIGRHLCEKLRGLGLEYFAPGRDAPLVGRALGDVIYCIGLTADFRARAFDTVEAHVGKLLSVVRDCNFDSLLYLSSTRLYQPAGRVACEEDALRVAPFVPGDLYNISKAMGESLTLNCGRKARVARISSVYGDDFTSENFLSSVLRDAVCHGRVTLRTAPDSERDYVAVDATVASLLQIASGGRHQIYNVAGGINVSHRVVAARLQEITGCTVEFMPDAPQVRFPPISIQRMKAEFDFRGSDVLADLEDVVNLYKKQREDQ